MWKTINHHESVYFYIRAGLKPAPTWLSHCYSFAESVGLPKCPEGYFPYVYQATLHSLTSWARDYYNDTVPPFVLYIHVSNDSATVHRQRIEHSLFNVQQHLNDAKALLAEFNELLK